jgi:hypothetical protein
VRLFIKIVNGSPFEHPMVEENFVQVFPDIDINNLPEGYAEFKRKETRRAGVYEVFERTDYVWNGDIVEDSHIYRDMTEEEKTTKQNEVKALWAENGYASWVFNEETCSFDPPTPYPDDGNSYSWDEETTSWVEVTDA